MRTTARFKVSQRQPNSYTAAPEQECDTVFLPPEQITQKICVVLVLSHGVDHQVHARAEGEMSAVCTASNFELKLSERGLWVKDKAFSMCC